jgi:CRISPR system Cascade subunit CasB
MAFEYFIEYLEKNRENKRMLAALRRGLGKEDPEQNFEAAPYILPLLSSEKIYPETRKKAYVVASLFAWHPLEGGTGSLGTSMQKITKRSDSMDRRFLSLVDSDEDVFFNRVQQVIGILKSRGVAVNWKQFMNDYLDWGYLDKRVQKKWLRDFYKEEKK